MAREAACGTGTDKRKEVDTVLSPASPAHERALAAMDGKSVELEALEDPVAGWRVEPSRSTVIGRSLAPLHSLQGFKPFFNKGHGHISPFFELAKALNDSDRFSVYICSTAANLVYVKKTLRNERLSLAIKVIELLLPELTDLPSQLHFTNGLPVHLMPILKQAFDLSSPRFLEFLENLIPDLLIYDILQPWAPTAAARLGIPSVVFITTSVAASMYHF
ncbi:hypothetical protein Tco_0449731 [Tanacetum coccineum]